MTRWSPFERATTPVISPSRLREMAQYQGVSEEEMRKRLDLTFANALFYRNNLYQVQINKVAPPAPGWPEIAHLSIRRLDRAQVGKSRYRDFMRIKDELIGSEYEAVELYPARSREVDASNQYHLWVLLDPEMHWPFGYMVRDVSEDNVAGSLQTPFAPQHRVPAP